jgi:Uma2 family endonuclease
MTTATPPNPVLHHPLTAADLPDLIRALGDVPPERVLLDPPPGSATEEDLIRLVDGDNKLLCELVDGTLVEKGMGIREAQLAAAIITVLSNFVRPRNLGIVAGADAMLRMTGGNVRLPDVSFIAWADIPGGKVPEEAIGTFPPTIAVEVLSPSNPRAEMARKRREYFATGTKLVWEVDLRHRTVVVYTAPDRSSTLQERDTLSGGDVLPGFSVALAAIFGELDAKAS